MYENVFLELDEALPYLASVFGHSNIAITKWSWGIAITSNK